jgi:hypothetical protein
MRDRDIRQALHQALHLEHAGDDETLIVHELGLCQGAVRADIAVINGALAAFEIKSDQDTLERLPRQAASYERVFDYITLVVGKKHALGISKRIPRCWGVVVVSEEGDSLSLDVRKPARQNKRTDPVAIAELLWRDEALKLLAERGLDRGLRSKPRRHLWDALAENLSPSDLSHCVRRTLRARADWRSDQRRSRCGGS